MTPPIDPVGETVNLDLLRGMHGEPERAADEIVRLTQELETLRSGQASAERHELELTLDELTLEKQRGEAARHELGETLWRMHKAEREREGLRAALEEIAGYVTDGDYSSTAGTLAEIAREALRISQGDSK